MSLQQWFWYARILNELIEDQERIEFSALDEQGPAGGRLLQIPWPLTLSVHLMPSRDLRKQLSRRSEGSWRFDMAESIRLAFEAEVEPNAAPSKFQVLIFYLPAPTTTILHCPFGPAHKLLSWLWCGTEPS